MKTLEIFLILLCVCGTAWAFTTKTGQGYYSWNGQVIADYSFLPNSIHVDVDGVTATDTNGVNPTINKDAFGNYVCMENNNC